MPRYIRTNVSGGTYFFTVTLADRGSDLLVREVDRLRSAYAAVCRRRSFETVAICVLPEHLHAIWRLPTGDAAFAQRWSRIKAAFSAGLEAAPGLTKTQRARREKGLWQRRYWEHQVRDEEDLARHVEYIHWNPVKHGLVQCVRDWPYSSFHRWVARGDLPVAWGLAQGAGTREMGYGE